MHRFANPARFVRLARPLTAWFGWSGALLVVIALVGGLFLIPPDYLQGQTVRILCIHVPMAWLGMAGWTGIAVASFMQIVWRHPLAAIAARACAAPGAVFTALCLMTGSIWGRPTWGTWWQWDGRMTSTLILFFFYLAYIALAAAAGREESGRRISAIFGLVGAIDLPIMHFSVRWWNTLHQAQSIGLTGTSIDSSILWPLPLSLLGFTLIFASVVLMRMRTMLAEAKVEARLQRMAEA